MYVNLEKILYIKEDYYEKNSSRAGALKGARIKFIGCDEVCISVEDNIQLMKDLKAMNQIERSKYGS